MLLEKIKNIRKNSAEICSFFYQEKIAEGYRGVNNLVEQLIELINEIGQLQEYNSKLEWIERLKEVLMEAIEAMQEKDTVLLADIIQYDLGEILEQMEE